MFFLYLSSHNIAIHVYFYVWLWPLSQAFPLSSFWSLEVCKNGRGKGLVHFIR